MKIPTVDDLVKVFKDNNWTPKQTDGADLHNVLQGKCCALPAIVKFVDPDYDFSKVKREQEIYNFVARKYGLNERNALYSGFDLLSMNGGLDPQFYNLGKELYERLTTENVQSTYRNID